VSDLVRPLSPAVTAALGRAERHDLRDKVAVDRNSFWPAERLRRHSTLADPTLVDALVEGRA